jgi:hypothetical protein
LTRLTPSLLLLASTAHASTVMPLSPDALYAGADRVVDGTVISRETRWDAAPANLETHAVIAIEATVKGPATATTEIVVPGG